jgi:hypothetical protein
VPDGFYSPYSNEQIFEFMGNGNSIEYLPKGENFDNWSKIITIHLFTRSGANAENITQKVVDNISSAPIVMRYELVGHKENKHSSYTSSSKVLQYIQKNGRVEMLYMIYYSGPYDCSGVQYTKVLPSWLDGDAAKQEADKLEDEIAKHLHFF